MQVVKIRKSTVSKIEMASLLIRTYALMKDIKLGDTDVDILAYMMVYGFRKSTKKLILDSKILKTSNSVYNTLSKLRKLGLISRDRDGLNIPCVALNVDFKSGNMGVIINLQNV